MHLYSTRSTSKVCHPLFFPILEKHNISPFLISVMSIIITKLLVPQFPWIHYSDLFCKRIDVVNFSSHASQTNYQYLQLIY